MKHYIGLDVSMEETNICVVDETGRIVNEAVVLSDPDCIAEYIEGLSIPIELMGLESGSISHWLTEELRDRKLPVKCLDARHCAGFLKLRINKNDRNDARGIAEIMRLNAYKEVHIKPREARAVSSLLGSRSQLVKQHVQTMNSIRGFLKGAGIRLGTISRTEAGLEKIMKAAEGLEPVFRIAVKGLVEAARGLRAAIADLDKEVRAAVKRTPTAQLLMTIPGLGPITALRFIVELGDPKRFEKSRSVGAYCGLTPRQSSSGETNRMGRISKCGPKELRSLLVEAAVVMLTRTSSWSKLKAWGLRLMKRSGLKKAAVAVARKLSVIMHRMLLTQESFRFTDKTEATAAA